MGGRASCGKTINLSHVANAWDSQVPKTFATSLICGHGPTYPAMSWICPGRRCQATDMRLSPQCLPSTANYLSISSSRRTVSNNIFLDTIFDCMPRITCHRLRARDGASGWDGAGSVVTRLPSGACAARCWISATKMQARTQILYLQATFVRQSDEDWAGVDCELSWAAVAAQLRFD